MRCLEGELWTRINSRSCGLGSVDCFEFMLGICMVICEVRGMCILNGVMIC